MNDVIVALEKAVSRDQELLVELKKGISELAPKIPNYYQRVQDLRAEVKNLYDTEGGAEFNERVELKLKVVSEYSRRIEGFIEIFRISFPKVLYHLKQVRIQITMSQMQLKYQYEVFTDSIVLEKFSDNIKMIVNLVKSLADRVTQLQTNYIVSAELASQIEGILTDLQTRAANLKSKILKP